ncbi:unnamed protein product [Owenia fusiformis]|uniref:Uncharacterized protein n=1 Tax=Owenia fusiformis TaxID=6347 RepID=A0A8J1TTJ3_OWEFU|nr:unnamed protein product [Owenia fusiformis]
MAAIQPLKINGNKCVFFLLVVLYHYRLMDLQGERSVIDNHDTEAIVNRRATITLPPDKSSFAFDCNNIGEIELVKPMGKGVTKETYLGKYKGEEYAVQFVTKDVISVKDCVGNLKSWEVAAGHARTCTALPLMKIMKGILIAMQLNHPNLIRLVGFCAKGETVESEDSDNLSTKSGVVAVYEYAEKLTIQNIELLDWEQRLAIAIDMSDMLQYLEESRLGSILALEFGEKHVLMGKDNRIRLIDFDDFDGAERSCDRPKHKLFKCNCENGVCKGHNAKSNMFRFQRSFADALLDEPVLDSSRKEKILKKTRRLLRKYNITATVLKQRLTALL